MRPTRTRGRGPPSGRVSHGPRSDSRAPAEASGELAAFLSALRLLAAASLHGDVLRGLLRRQPDLDLVRAHDRGLRAAADQLILEHAALDGRVVVSQDLETMIGFSYARVRLDKPLPGLSVLRQGVPIGDAIEAILLVTMCRQEGEWDGQVLHLPL